MLARDARKLAPLKQNVSRLKMSRSDYPEIKGFHAQSFLMLTPAVVLAFASGGIGIYLQEEGRRSDPLYQYSTYGFFVAFAYFIIAFVYIGLIRKPKCPGCSKPMKYLQSQYISNSNWRIFECIPCDLKFKVPGITFGD